MDVEEIEPLDLDFSDRDFGGVTTWHCNGFSPVVKKPSADSGRIQSFVEATVIMNWFPILVHSYTIISL